MKIVPQSEVSLYAGVETSRPLVFSSPAKLKSYFDSKRQYAYVNFTTVKKNTGKLRIELAGNLVRQCNYISFKNPAFDNKLFYARIFDYDYINNECVEITYGINYWYSFMHEINFRSALIEREHLSEHEYEISQANPFTHLIPSFKTPEGLQIDKDLENVNYTYKSDAQVTEFKGVPGKHLIKDRIKELSNTNFGIYTMPFYVITLSEVDPPSDEEDAWWLEFRNSLSGYETEQSRMGGVVRPGVTKIEFSTDFKNTYLLPFVERPEDIWSTVGTEFHGPTHILILDKDGFNELCQHVALWGAVNAIVSAYAIPLYLLIAMIDWGSDQGSQFSFLDQVSVSIAGLLSYFNDIDSKKLLTFPYTYLRMTTPNGDEKEYHLEDNEMIASFPISEDTAFAFRIAGSIGNVPHIDMVPYHYKSDYVSEGLSGGLPLQNQDGNEYTNYFERMSFNAFPQIPYNTDGYLSFLASSAQSLMRGNTQMNKLSMQEQAMSNDASRLQAGLGTWNQLFGGASNVPVPGEAVSYERYNASTKPPGHTGLIGVKDPMSTAIGIGTGVARGVVGATSALANDYYAEESYRRQQELLARQAQMYNQSNDLSIANLENNAIAQNYKMARNSFAMSDYHAGTIDGAEYFDYDAPLDFMLKFVTLRKDILRKYDAYFKAYGYNSGRYGIPLVCNFVRGQQTSTVIPHFADLFEDPFKVTYIKTQAMEIDVPYKPVEDFVKAMFNGGTQFINGDLLVNSNG